MAAANETKSTGRVLVIKQDPGARELLLCTLRQGGHEVEGASDGIEALTRLHAREFDAVLTDLQMPRLDGLSLLQRINASKHAIPVLMQTTLPSADLETTLYEAGAFRVLMKGGPMRDLLRSVEAACQVARQARTHSA